MPRTADPPSRSRSASATPDRATETLEEHSRLHAAVDTIEAVLAFPPRHGSDLWTATVVERLDTLHAALAVHFAAEEGRRLFEMIEEEKPGSAAACRRLRGEHRRLLTDLGSLRADLAAAKGDRAPQRGWVRRARVFLRALREHEETENALLFDAVERPDTALD
jgi:hemerythrin-like domain-containing protein